MTVVLFMLVALIGCGGTAGRAPALEAGWISLFDGRTLEGWHRYGTDSTEGWRVDNGVIRASRGGGDLASDAEFGDFELVFDWKLEPGGNSGVFYRVVEDTSRFAKPGFTGPEYQIIDDEGWPNPLEDWQRTGSNYALQGPSSLPTRPIGEWNTSRIVAVGPHVEHWLNGVKVVEYEIGSEDWRRRLREGKYDARTGYARAPRGHIVLQSHGGKGSFRNIRIRPLSR